jgi:hypothetical protein
MPRVVAMALSKAVKTAHLMAKRWEGARDSNLEQLKGFVTAWKKVSSSAGETASSSDASTVRWMVCAMVNCLECG